MSFVPSRRHAHRCLALGLAAAVTAPSGFLAACSRRPVVIKVGFLGGLTGTVAELGVEGRNGALLAAEELSAAAGASRIEVVPMDDRQNADVARAAVQALAQQGVAFAVGPMTSAMAVAVVPEAQRLGLVLISPTATTDELSGKPDVFYRVAADASYGARQLADAAAHAGGQRFALLLDARNRSYSASFGNAFAARVKAQGGTVTGIVEYQEADVDFRALSERLLAERPDTVLIVAGVGDSALVAQQLRRQAPALRLVVTPWAANARFLQLGGRNVEGTIAQQALDLASPAPAFVAFRQRYRTRFGEDATTPAVQSYEALALGIAALREADGAHTLQQVLGQPGRHWPGLYSDILLDANGDTARSLHLAQVRDGRFAAFAP